MEWKVLSGFYDTRRRKIYFSVSSTDCTRHRSEKRLAVVKKRGFYSRILAAWPKLLAIFPQNKSDSRLRNWIQCPRKSRIANHEAKKNNPSFVALQKNTEREREEKSLGPGIYMAARKKSWKQRESSGGTEPSIVHQESQKASSSPFPTDWRHKIPHSGSWERAHSGRAFLVGPYELIKRGKRSRGECQEAKKFFAELVEEKKRKIIIIW